jgi:hypothetical protein
MYYLVNTDHNDMAAHLTRSAVHPVQWMGLIICCGTTVKRVGMVELLRR